MIVRHSLLEVSVKIKVSECNKKYLLLLEKLYLIVPPFQIRMLNGSPRVIGNSVQIDFSPTKTAVSRCTIDGHTQDCKL